MTTESLNRILYGSKLTAYTIMRRSTYVLTLLAVGLLVYAHGVEEDPRHLRLLYQVIDAILSIFVLIYLARILYAFERVKFLRRTWFEGILMGVIFLNEFSTYVAVDRTVGRQVADRLNSGKVKGKSVKARLVTD